MNSKPLVTLILICYEQEKYVAEAIDSCLMQDYENLEVILSDDGSKDKTFEIIKEKSKKYEGIHKVIINRNDSNMGLAEHLNKLYSLANGEYIVHAAGDDICFPEKVNKLVKPMLSNDNIMGVCSSITEIDLDGKVLKIREHKEHHKLNDIEYILENSSSVVSQSHAFRRIIFTYFGGILSEVSNEGKVLALREALLGKIAYVDEPLTYYRIGSGISTQNPDDVNKLTISEPIKVAHWNYSFIKQASVDILKLDKQSEEIYSLINNRLSYLESVYLLNKYGRAELILKLMFKNRIKFKLILIFLRRRSPYFIRKLYCDLRRLSK